ncbi:MAG: hypothetical protein LBS59_06570 [Puniceicoccales bacterium]|jgi:peptidyl-prolyl cis-trans isomerase D|nr:hypothetical protein [Puniceicoccales bacterium]
MITWLQTSFTRHHRVLLAALLGLTIVSFVFFGAWSGVRGSKRPSPFLGVDLNSQRESAPYEDFIRFSGAFFPDHIAGLDLKTVVLLKHLADTAQIPDPSPEQIRKLLESCIPSLSDPAKLNQWLADGVADISIKLGIRPEDAQTRFNNFLVTFCRLKKVQDVLAGPGYALPFDGVISWLADTTLWTIETATLSASTFSPKIPTPDDALNRYFDENKETFRLPPVVSASYAVFSPIAEDSASVPAPSDPELRAYAHNNAQDIKIPGFDIKRLDEFLKSNRADLEKSWRIVKTRDNLAGRISALLADKLPIEDIAKPDRITSFLSDNGSVETPLPPFDKDTVPSTLPIPAVLLGNALKLSPEIWHSDVYPLPDKVVVFFHKRTVPSRIPEFAEAREKITAAFSAKEKQRLFSEHARLVGEQLRKAAAAGKTLAQSAPSFALSLENLPPFTFASLPEKFSGVSNFLKMELNSIPEGGVTFLPLNSDNFLYVRLLKKGTPSLDTGKAEIQLRTKEAALNAAQFTLIGDPKDVRKPIGILQELRIHAEPRSNRAAPSPSDSPNES